MPLLSSFFRGNRRLVACQVNDADHVLLGSKGDHVSKIQIALQTLDNAKIDDGELLLQFYGRSTARAVLRYKARQRIINRSYQTQADDIVGKMTITQMDAEMADIERRSPRRVGNGECCGTPPGLAPPRPAPSPAPSPFPIRRSGNPNAIGDLVPSPSDLSGLDIPLNKVITLNFHWAYTALGELIAGRRHEALIGKAAQLLAPFGMAPIPHTIAPDTIADFDVVEPYKASDTFRVRKRAGDVRPTVPADVVRVIVVPFVRESDEFAVTEDRRNFDERFPPTFPPFILLNANALNPDHCTLLHEMIHCTGEKVHDPDGGKSVFSVKSTVRNELRVVHAAQLKNSFFARQISAPPGPG